ncbi:MAG: hypothetical protein LBD53_00535 [Tannerella sp.]|nr:hypothetical protein [Tannerella sp.]
MDTNIQEITEKIYREGVERGNEEAAKIVAAAREKETAILKEADNKAQEIIAAAEKKAADLRKNTEAELKMFASQALEALKSEAANLITGKITAQNVKAATADVGFMQKVILETAKEWAKNGQAVISAANAQALKDYFVANAKMLLDSGLIIAQVNGKPTSFTLAPADGSYRISFGDDEFIAYFKDFLRPQLIEMLF